MSEINNTQPQQRKYVKTGNPRAEKTTKQKLATYMKAVEKIEQKCGVVITTAEEYRAGYEIWKTPEDANKNIRIKWMCHCKTILSAEQLFDLTNTDCYYVENHTTKQINPIAFVCECAPCKKDNGTNIGYSAFVKLLEDKNWEMISPRGMFINDKIPLLVSCSNGHITSKTFARCKLPEGKGSGCAECQRLSMTSLSQKGAEKIFLDKGCQLLGIYKNTHDSLDYKCKCGEFSKTSVNNMRRNVVGCDNCAKLARKKPWCVIENYFEKSGCTLLTQEHQYVNNRNLLEYICFCGNESAETCWHDFVRGQRCIECAPARRAETCMRKYGVDNSAKAESSKLKQKETWLKTLGVEHNMKNKACKENAKQTNMTNHGGVHNLALVSTRKLATEAHMVKHGYMPGLSPIIREKMCETNKIRYGADYYLKSDACKKYFMTTYGNQYFVSTIAFETEMVLRYGVKHALQNSELFSKMLKSSFATKSYTLPSGNMVELQGYEIFGLNDLLNSNIKEDDIFAGLDDKNKRPPMIKYVRENGKSAVYYPDLYIKTQNKIVEIKSSYTYFKDEKNNLLKFKACYDAGYAVEMWAYNEKGMRIMTMAYEKCNEQSNNGDYSNYKCVTSNEWNKYETTFRRKCDAFIQNN